MAEFALFDIENDVLTPTVHCHTLKALSEIMVLYPDCYLEVYKYLYYMCSHHPKRNPFFDMIEIDKEEAILAQIDSSGFTSEDDAVQEALALCKHLWTTPTSRSYFGFKQMLDNLTSYMTNTEFKDGRDGNITALVSAGKSFDGLRQSFKGVFKDLMEEQSSTARGNAAIAYDQRS